MYVTWWGKKGASLWEKLESVMPKRETIRAWGTNITEESLRQWFLKYKLVNGYCIFKL